MRLTNDEAIRAWSQFSQEDAANFGEEGDLARRLLLNPAIFGLLGEVAGKVILDAGCGQGYLCRLLSKRGASITGIEPAEGWYTFAAQREQAEALGIRYLQEDLSLWRPEPDTFDGVIANMVLMDIPDYLPALGACVASLKPAGRLILSILHPCFEEPGATWSEKGYVETRDYFEERAVSQSVGHYIHRPLSAYLNSVIQAGCRLDSVLEPRLDEASARQYHAERYAHVPGYLLISATKGA
ncbi:MAG: class I SAM-dependent methyltransferase [Nitrososphaerota archaeon]